VDAATDAAACAASAVAARHLPLDIYLMLNQSSSMSDTVSGGTKWSAIRSALDTFLQQPLTDVSVGIGFFGVPPTSSQCTVTTCAQDSDCGPAACGPCDPVSLTCAGATSQDSCAPADYANPAVEIAPLPGVYGGIHAAVLAHGPSTHTPTSAALQGAVDHASSWGGFYPQHVTIVILTTDGEPNECDTSPTHIEAIAAGGVAGTPKILTFVIGVGSSVSTLSGIANAGGTSTAFIIDTGGSVQQQFLQAMNQIRGEALGCVYEIPGSGDAGVLDSSRINVQYTPGSGGAAQVIPMAPDRASCPVSGDAWYYDTASAPSRILLCPNTCSRITPDTSGEVDILLGCATEVIG
jgi:hypothetical protein